MKKFLNENLNTLIKTQSKNNRGNSISPTTGFWIKRIFKLLIETLFITWAVFTLVFLLFNMIPGMPAFVQNAIQKIPETIDGEVNPAYTAAYDNAMAHIHADGSILNRYIWSIRGIFDGTLGISWDSGNPVSIGFWSRFATSVTIGFIAISFSFVIGIPTGIYLARRQNKYSDTLASVISVFSFSIPSFVIGLVIVGINFWLGLPVVFEYGNIYIYLLSALVISIPVGFAYTRYLRTSIRQEYGEQYVALARVKGISEKEILTKHILKPALFPIVNYLPFLVVGVFFGSITIESVFRIPGTGQMLIDAATKHDQSTILAITTLYTFFTVISFFVRDLLITFIDPRIKGE